MELKIKIPKYAKNKAKEALDYNSKLPEYKRVGITRTEANKLNINSGIERAKQLIRNKYLYFDDIKSVANFYLRFRNCKTQRCEMAINLWGGRQFGLKCSRFIKQNKKFKIKFKKIDRTKNYCRYRQFAPSKCKKNSYKTKNISKSTKLVLCKNKKHNKLKIQSIIKKHNNKSCFNII